MPKLHGLLPITLIFLVYASFVNQTWAIDAPLRRPISNTNPLFAFNYYQDWVRSSSGPWSGSVTSLFANVPEKLKPYSAIHFVATDMYGDGGVSSVAAKADMLKVLRLADSAGIWFMIQCNAGGATNYYMQMSDAFIDSLFAYPKFLGFFYSEISIQLDCENRLPWGDMVKQVNGCARNGGYVIWQDMTMSTYCTSNNKQTWTELDTSLVNAYKSHKRNIILQDKHNSYGGANFTNTGSIFGWAVSGMIENWGWHAEDWDWQANAVPGFGALGSDNLPWDSPKAGFGIDFLMAVPFGCTVYSGEAPNNLTPGPQAGTLAPGVKMVVLPLWTKIVEDSLIPTMDEVRSRIKVAVHASVKSAPQLALDEIYKGLYGPSRTSTYEWWPSTGRYGLIPILPPQASTAEFSKFTEVVHTNSLPWTTEAEKVSWFNTRYPIENHSSGNAWFYNSGNNWFISSPEESGTLNPTFKFDLKNSPSLQLGGDFRSFAFAIVKEQKGKLKVYFNNYHLSQMTLLTSANASLENGHVRSNTLRIYGLSSQPTIDQVTLIKGYNNDNNSSAPTSSWDATNKIFTINLNMNGSVDMTIGHADFLVGASTKAQSMKQVSSIPSTSSLFNIISLDGRIVKSGISPQQARTISRSQYYSGVYFVQLKHDARIGATIMLRGQ